MARILLGFLAKNKLVQRFRKTNNILGANWLKERYNIGNVGKTGSTAWAYAILSLNQDVH